MYELIGKCVVFYIIFRLIFSLLKGFYGSFVAAAFGLNTNVRKMGQWAVVTGSTDGIGKAYAFEMARKGLNVVLISRSPVKLQSVASEIKSLYDIEIKQIDVDFTRRDIYERIERELKGLDIGVLINNVGMNVDHADYYLNYATQQFLENILMCNNLSLLMMTKIVLPGMLAKKKGLIINVSSTSSLVSTPLLAVYASTKAFVTKFSKDLELEVRDKGIVVQCVCPSFVVTNMSKLRRPSIMIPSAKGYVFSALKTTGVEKLTAGYFMHKLQLYGIELLQHLPSVVMDSLSFKQLDAARRAALRKKEREAKKE